MRRNINAKKRINLFYVFIIAAASYLILVLWLWRGWMMLPRFEKAGGSVPVSVVIPMRNEAANIASLLSDIAAQHYPQEFIRVVVVNDHSTDRSAAEVEEFACNHPNVALLHLPDGKYGKKAALQYALPYLTGALAVTTDADCRATPRWLATIAAFYEDYRPTMIIGPVMLACGQSFFSRWQALELASLTGAAAGAAAWRNPVMCSGANLAIELDAMKRYAAVYDSQFASGDDMMMMFEIKKNAGRIMYLKSTCATVLTFPSPDLKSFVRQRTRWTSKSRAYADTGVIVAALIVFAANISIPVCLAIGLFRLPFLWLAIILWAAKALIDWPFLHSLCRFWKVKSLTRIFIPAQLLYPFYAALTGIAGNIAPVRWKGRKSRY
jgi:cellulose synthase/poly-beta-1,6-N-acetylglucosamine synthase-like glycosyltransferase